MKTITIMRWVARIISVLLAVFLTIAGFAIFYHGFMNRFLWTDFFASALLLCLILGLVISWPRENAGIIMAYVGVLGLFILTMAISDKEPLWLFLLAIPPTILFLCSYAESKPDQKKEI